MNEMKKFLLMLFLALFVSQLMAQSQERFNENEEQTAPAEEDDSQKNGPSKQPSRATAPKKDNDFWSKTRFGGNFGAGFGNNQTFINISPRMYYAATDKWWLGTGVTFIYSQYKLYAPPYDKSTVYGLNFFTTYQFLGPLFVQAEYEPLNFEQYLFDPVGDIVGERRIWVNGLLLGGGISQPMGRGRFFASVLYNVTWRSTIDSYYASPWIIRFGVGL